MGEPIRVAVQRFFDRPRSSWAEIIGILLGLCTIVAAGIATWIYHGQLVVSQQQLEVAQAQLKAEERPWVSASVDNTEITVRKFKKEIVDSSIAVLSSDLQLSKMGYNPLLVTTEFSLSNTGRTPAENVSVYIKPLLNRLQGITEDKIDKVLVHQMNLRSTLVDTCTENPSTLSGGPQNPSFLGDLIFPGQSKIVEDNITLSASDLINKIGQRGDGVPDIQGLFVLSLLVCVHYSDSNTHTSHVSGEVYNISVKDESNYLKALTFREIFDPEKRTYVTRPANKSDAFAN